MEMRSIDSHGAYHELLDLTVSVQALAQCYKPAAEQELVVVHSEGGERRLAKWLWRLTLACAKEANIGIRLVNAHSDSVGVKMAFYSAWRTQCRLILVDGFNDWMVEKKARQL